MWYPSRDVLGWSWDSDLVARTIGYVHGLELDPLCSSRNGISVLSLKISSGALMPFYINWLVSYSFSEGRAFVSHWQLLSWSSHEIELICSSSLFITHMIANLSVPWALHNLCFSSDRKSWFLDQTCLCLCRIRHFELNLILRILFFKLETLTTFFFDLAEYSLMQFL